MIMPLNVHLVYTDEPKSERVRAVTYCVPVDDTHQLGASVRWLADDETESLSGRDARPGGRKDRSFGCQRHPATEAWWGRGRSLRGWNIS
jgi:hypothetical protein